MVETVGPEDSYSHDALTQRTDLLINPFEEASRDDLRINPFEEASTGTGPTGDEDINKFIDSVMVPRSGHQPKTDHKEKGHGHIQCTTSLKDMTRTGPTGQSVVTPTTAGSMKSAKEFLKTSRMPRATFDKIPCIYLERQEWNKWKALAGPHKVQQYMAFLKGENE